MSWRIRYKPGTDLARRFPEPTRMSWPTSSAADRARLNCANAEKMEVFES